MAVEIRPDDPMSPEVAPLLDRHLELMWAVSPPESVHALGASDLRGADVRFFTLREDGRVCAMAALKRLAPDHGEIKSMHVVAEARGRGFARRMLAHLLEEARREGFRRLSLETGAEPEFAPARALYHAAGFGPCAPFGSYREDPNSVFMTRALDPAAGSREAG